MNLALWIVQGPLANVQQHFPWANHVPTALVRLIGACELLGGIGLVLPSALLIFPWLTVAAGLVLLMLCAAFFHAWRREYPSIGTTIVLLMLSLLIVIGRWAWV